MLKNRAESDVMGLRRVRNKAYQDRRLAETAVAAGAAFGWAEGDRDNRSVIAAWQARRMMTLVVPSLAAFPLAVGLAVYLVG